MPTALRSLFLLGGLVAVGAAFASPAHAQGATSVGAGWVWPVGSLDDRYDRGIMLRGQQSFQLLILQVHLQGGFTRLSGVEDAVIPDSQPRSVVPSADAADMIHAGMGLRLGLGLGWVGGTAAYFIGDLEDEVAYLPEVGVRLGPAELVGEFRLGDRRWAGLRAGITF